MNTTKSKDLFVCGCKQRGPSSCYVVRPEQYSKMDLQGDATLENVVTFEFFTELL